jgi:hypothetical protein
MNNRNTCNNDVFTNMAQSHELLNLQSSLSCRIQITGPARSLCITLSVSPIIHGAFGLRECESPLEMDGSVIQQLMSPDFFTPFAFDH